MSSKIKLLILFLFILFGSCSHSIQSPVYKGINSNLLFAKSDSIINDTIVYHAVRIDQNGNILPWYSPNLGESYDYVLNKVWHFWKNLPTDSNGQKYYMNHQVWRPNHDKRGIGGDQFMMALSSWDLYYNYTGDESIIKNMRNIADYYLANSLSSPKNEWPNLPYPYNMNVESGIYDGDMILGKNYLQPDKAGSFGFELVKLYKKTGQMKYLNAAITIANTLAEKVKPGDSTNSPWPFKVNAVTGDPGIIVLDQEVWYEGMDKDLKQHKRTMKSLYTTNWTSTLKLFNQLIELKKGSTSEYKRAFNIALEWMKNYPAKTNKWGPFFEDVPRWSDTQINAITYAMFLIEHPQFDSQWKETVSNIFKWVHKELSDSAYLKYGVIPIDEQTAYRVPGNSHSSREASVELMYWEKTGDTSFIENDLRQLNWATYMVDNDGKNFYPTNDIWMTDGYGDYVRHYLRAMAAAPQLAPSNKDHLLQTTSIVKKIFYTPTKIDYITYDSNSEETFRLTSKPLQIKVNGKNLKERENLNSNGWIWMNLQQGGILKIKKTKGNNTEILK